MTKWTDMQRQALDSCGNLLISASAGSGKTTVMVQKIADYLFSSETADISKLVVITFTKAIAEEMKQKLTDKLYEKLRSSTNDNERERIRKQINGISLSNISTIDSFCAEIFKRYFEVINKDPLVSLLEQSEADYMFAESREEVLERYLASDDEKFIELIDKFTARRDIDRLRKALDDIHKFLAVQADADNYIFKALLMLGGKAEDSETSQYVMAHYRKKAARLADICESKFQALDYFSNEGKVFSGYRDALCSCRDSLLNITHAQNINNLFTIASLLQTVKCPTLYSKGLEEPEITALNDAKFVISASNDFIKEVFNHFGGDFKDAKIAETETRKAAIKLFEIACEVDTEYRKRKDGEKRVDFADIEHYALQILNNEAVAEELRNSVDSIFIDEYQDTNYLQESIIARISRGNVFMVGDVKQSIYKFRFAEPAIFLDKRERYETVKDGLNINFNENFRSSKKVLDFINQVFDEIMVYDLGGIDYRKDARLIYGPEDITTKKNDFPDAEIALFENEKSVSTEYPEVYSVLSGPRYTQKPSAEAIYIADRIAAMAGKALIYDAKEKLHRPCRYVDIAILLRARSCGDEIIAELRRRNLPFSAEGFRETGDSASTDLLICFAKVLDNPCQDLPLAAVMLSYMGKFCDKEMLEIRAETPKGYFWEAVNAYKGNQTIQTKISTLLELLDKYRRLAAFIDMRELLERLISETGYDGYLLSKGDNPIRRLNAFVFSLTGKENASGLKSFLNLCGSAAEESLTPSAADDCITLTTIHKSKGLEYPVVFLACADYGTKGQQNSGSIMLDNNTGASINKRKNLMGGQMVAMDVKLGMAVMHTDDTGRRADTISTIALQLKQESERKSELIRLFYVAMTRARQHLFITGKASAKDYLFPYEPSSFVGLLQYAQSRGGNLNKYFVYPKPQAVEVPEDKCVYIPREAQPIILDREYSYADSIALSCKYSVSSLSKRQTDPDMPSTYNLNFDSASQSDKIALGTAYHSVLQYADFARNTPAEVDTQINTLLASGKIAVLPKDFDFSVMYKAFANPRFMSLSLTKCYREQSFMLYAPACEVTDTQSRDKVLVQGIIDFLSVGTETVLIDYKFTSASIDEVQQRYRKQLDIYTMAAQQALNLRIDRREIYLIGRDEFVSM